MLLIKNGNMHKYNNLNAYLNKRERKWNLVMRAWIKLPMYFLTDINNWQVMIILNKKRG